MSELKTLLENYWVCKDENKELYYQVKRGIPTFQKFVREQLGWRLIHTEHLIKLEKLPAHAESFMGIQEFTEVRDYVLLCVVLMYLEDKEEQEQFLLTELIQFIEACLKQYMEVDWTSFSQRKSLVRVLLYAEQLQMLRVYDGKSEAFGLEAGQEVLYENTGYSKYYAASFPMDISELETWEDFEHLEADTAEGRSTVRVNRIFRQLVTAPVLQWEDGSGADAMYLKKQRQWIDRTLKEHMGGRLDVHKNAAFWVFEQEESCGKVHPREAMLPEVILLICSEIRYLLEQGILKKQDDEHILLSVDSFAEIVSSCREKWGSGWSKEYREMEQSKLFYTVKEYMKNWMMLSENEDGYEILPAAGKMTGEYPADYFSR